MLSAHYCFKVLSLTEKKKTHTQKNDVAALAPALGRYRVPIGYSSSSPSVLRWLDGLPHLPQLHRLHESGVRRETRRAATIEAERTELRENRTSYWNEGNLGVQPRVGVWIKNGPLFVCVCLPVFFWRWKRSPRAHCWRDAACGSETELKVRCFVEKHAIWPLLIDFIYLHYILLLLQYNLKITLLMVYVYLFIIIIIYLFCLKPVILVITTKSCCLLEQHR